MFDFVVESENRMEQEKEKFVIVIVVLMIKQWRMELCDDFGSLMWLWLSNNAGTSNKISRSGDISDHAICNVGVGRI